MFLSEAIFISSIQLLTIGSCILAIRFPLHKEACLNLGMSLKEIWRIAKY